MRRLMTMLFCSLMLTGCGPQIIVMKNPQTGKVAQCNGTGAGRSRMANADAASDCARGYEAAGWVRMN
ncbi:hypothetical protein [Rhizosaccharibacter radicis]|uniref:Lipoprotein n=1 Tax=Rhizosaccharibacter radicis TaxID=2782605 RepID=A0ABT1VUC2_9PROT|nr:hypothetical protein [Acetobacteraceae bacterium KSS12]